MDSTLDYLNESDDEFDDEFDDGFDDELDDELDQTREPIGFNILDAFDLR